MRNAENTATSGVVQHLVHKSQSQIIRLPNVNVLLCHGMVRDSPLRWEMVRDSPAKKRCLSFWFVICYLSEQWDLFFGN
jgi:hypothetical protein